MDLEGQVPAEFAYNDSSPITTLFRRPWHNSIFYVHSSSVITASAI